MANKGDVGRPSLLDDKEYLMKIKELYLEGKTENEIQEILEIPKGTWNYWKYQNYHNFQENLLSYRLERMFQKSLNHIEALQASEDERVQLQANTLVAKGIGKKHFSERVEQTGADGAPLTITFDDSFKNK